MLRSTCLAAAAALVAGSALAADLPVRKAPLLPVAVAPVFTWTGFTFGTLTGYAISGDQVVRTVGITGAQQAALAAGTRPAAFRNRQDGFTSIGGGLGYDYQFTPGAGIVVGAAADATWTDLFRNRRYFGINAAGNTDVSLFRQGLDYLGTVRGRVGYAFDRFLVYGTGGFGFGNVYYRPTFFNAAGAVAFTGQYDNTATGYVYGGGVEYAIPTDSIFARFNLLSLVGIQSQAITAKFEYLHYDLGRRNVGVIPQLGQAGGYVSQFRTDGDLFRGGLTYRFGNLGSIFGVR